MLPTPERSRDIPAAIGRSIGFIVMLITCSLAAVAFVPPLVRGIYAVTGFSVRGDVIAMLAAVLATTAIMIRSVDRREWSELGLHRGAFNARAMVSGACIGAAAIAAACALLFATGCLHFEPMSSALSWPGTAAYTTIILLLAGLGEEVMCRGYLLTVLRESVGAPAAVGLTSVAFGLLHLSNPGVSVMSLLVVVISGIMLAWVRLAYDSLYAAWMAHVAWNVVMAVPLHAAVSGLHFETPGYQAVTSGPAWFSGGIWGPEGGLAAFAGSCGALGYLYMRQRRKES